MTNIHFNYSLNVSVFLTNCKKQNLIQIPKPGKTFGQPQSYRPNAYSIRSGNLYRILNSVEETNGISPIQNGLCKAKSTGDEIKLEVNRGENQRTFKEIMSGNHT